MEASSNLRASAAFVGVVVALTSPAVDGHNGAHASGNIPSSVIACGYLGQTLTVAVRIGSFNRTGDALVDSYKPRSEIGRRILALRKAYIEGGGRLMSPEEIGAEVRSRRGGAEGA